jgi:hypothetical protein
LTFADLRAAVKQVSDETRALRRLAIAVVMDGLKREDIV